MQAKQTQTQTERDRERQRKGDRDDDDERIFEMKTSLNPREISLTTWSMSYFIFKWIMSDNNKLFADIVSSRNYQRFNAQKQRNKIRKTRNETAKTTTNEWKRIQILYTAALLLVVRPFASQTARTRRTIEKTNIVSKFEAVYCTMFEYCAHANTHTMADASKRYSTTCSSYSRPMHTH